MRLELEDAPGWLCEVDVEIDCNCWTERSWLPASNSASDIRLLADEIDSCVETRSAGWMIDACVLTPCKNETRDDRDEIWWVSASARKFGFNFNFFDSSMFSKASSSLFYIPIKISPAKFKCILRSFAGRDEVTTKWCWRNRSRPMITINSCVLSYFCLWFFT